MNAKNWLLIPAFLTIGVIVLSCLVYDQLVSRTTLTEADIKTRISALYGGHVETIVKDDTHYNITFTIDDYIYEVVANEEYGTFEHLALIKEGTKQPIPEQPAPPAKQERLTKEEAIAIAKKENAGIVDDVDFYDNENGGYYIVELENDDAEVKLQIHAITGKILSVSFDD